tara:strand:- start:6159 stop:7037 length:879 start_codon:yes stop_codon:yes gene_type:complete
MNVNRKGIILAGGTGSRLYPVNKAASKQLLPIYDKPMIYYPLSTLMLAGIKEILIISGKGHLSDYKKLLGNGKSWGIKLEYAVQEEPKGIPEAYIIADSFLKDSPSALVLGDNLFFGSGFKDLLVKSSKEESSTTFTYRVNDPERFGVLEFSSKGKIIGIEEKPDKPKSNIVATGLYFFDARAQKIATTLTPSARGELEIKDLLECYIEEKSLLEARMGRGYAWFDAGTHTSLLNASNYVSTIQKLQGIQIGCLEEISFENKWITPDELKDSHKKMPRSEYSDFLDLYIRNI